MTDEEYVRSVWATANVRKTRSFPPYWPECGGNSVRGWPFIFEADAWSAAAEFTRERLEQVRQLREEIAWVQISEDRNTKVEMWAISSRIIARLESELAKLTQGMRPEALQ